MLREREAICNFKSVIHHKTQQHSLDHFIALSFFLVMFNDLQHNLQHKDKKAMLYNGFF